MPKALQTQEEAVVLFVLPDPFPGYSISVPELWIRSRAIGLRGLYALGAGKLSERSPGFNSDCQPHQQRSKRVITIDNDDVLATIR